MFAHLHSRFLDDLLTFLPFWKNLTSTREASLNSWSMAMVSVVPFTSKMAWPGRIWPQDSWLNPTKPALEVFLPCIIWQLYLHGWSVDAWMQGCMDGLSVCLSVGWPVSLSNGCTYVCTYVCTYACAYVCTYVCTYVWTYVCVHSRIYVLCVIVVRLGTKRHKIHQHEDGINKNRDLTNTLWDVTEAKKNHWLVVEAPEKHARQPERPS